MSDQPEQGRRPGRTELRAAGKGTTFDKAIGEFAIRYADQTERDYEALVQAEQSGRIAAERGV